MNTVESTATRIFLQTAVTKTKNINLHLPSGPVHPYQLEESISNFRDVWCTFSLRGARWLSGRVSDSGARGRGFETYLCRFVSLSKTLYSPKVLVNYPGSGGSVPT